MAYYSHQCVDCTEATKQCTGEYHGRDEDGAAFRGTMYSCDNPACKINYERRKTQRYLETVGNRQFASAYFHKRRS